MSRTRFCVCIARRAVLATLPVLLLLAGAPAPTAAGPPGARTPEETLREVRREMGLPEIPRSGRLVRRGAERAAPQAASGKARRVPAPETHPSRRKAEQQAR